MSWRRGFQCDRWGSAQSRVQACASAEPLAFALDAQQADFRANAPSTPRLARRWRRRGRGSQAFIGHKRAIAIKAPAWLAVFAGLAERDAAKLRPVSFDELTINFQIGGEFSGVEELRSRWLGQVRLLQQLGDALEGRFALLSEELPKQSDVLVGHAASLAVSSSGAQK
jgi:hypothetical protein